MTDTGLTIRGLQEAQRANLELIAAMKPGGIVSRVIVVSSTEVHRRLTANTPHDYGALRASRRIEVLGLEGRVFTDPGARHPRSRTPPVEYDQYLHAQGEIPGLRSGIRASMPHTVRTAGPRIINSAIRLVVRELP